MSTLFTSSVDALKNPTMGVAEDFVKVEAAAKVGSEAGINEDEAFDGVVNGFSGSFVSSTACLFPSKVFWERKGKINSILKGS